MKQRKDERESGPQAQGHASDASEAVVAALALARHALMSHSLHRHPRRDEGIPAAEVRVSPQPVTPELLLTSTRLNRTTAEAAVAALAAGGFLDAVRQPCRWFEVAHDISPIRRGL